MENIGDISAWLTPAIIIGLFLWLRADIRELRADLRTLEGRFEKRFDGMDMRLRAVEVGQAEIKGQLLFVRDYILGRNLRETEDAAEAASGD